MKTLQDLFTSWKPGEERKRIALGLNEFDKDKVNSLINASKLADLYIVTHIPEQFNTIRSPKIMIIKSKESELEEKLVSLLYNNEVDGILRGSLDAMRYENAYASIFNEKSITVPALLNKEDTFFFLSLCSGFHGWDKNETINEINAIAKFMKINKLHPKIAVFTAARANSIKNKKNIDPEIIEELKKYISNANYFVKHLKMNYEIKNYAVELHEAIEDGCNILVPVNGIVGNQLYRAFTSCGFQNIFSPRLGANEYWADNARNQKDFYPLVKTLAICIDKGISFKI